MRCLPQGAVQELELLVGRWNPQSIQVTGSGSARLATVLKGFSPRPITEFDAWARGVPVLAARARWTMPDRFLLISVGTGTSILEVTGAVVKRVGGVALGGGTLLGLGRLLCGAETFDEIVALAVHGDRGCVDLFVRDIYPDGSTVLRPDVTASSFGKLASRAPADLARALMWLVGENIGIACAGVAQARAIDTLLFGGTPLTADTPLRESLRIAVAASGQKSLFLIDGAYCGAIGAAVSGESPS